MIQILKLDLMQSRWLYAQEQLFENKLLENNLNNYFENKLFENNLNNYLKINYLKII